MNDPCFSFKKKLLVKSMSNYLVQPAITKSRYVLFPIRRHDVWALYKKAVGCFWIAEEIKLVQDRDDWEHRLNDDERFFISNILAFFSSSDSIIQENLAMNFIAELEGETEFINFYSYQLYSEGIHSETYSLLIDTLIRDPREKERIFNAMDTIPCIGRKANWARKWIYGSADAATAETTTVVPEMDRSFYDQMMGLIRERGQLEDMRTIRLIRTVRETVGMPANSMPFPIRVAAFAAVEGIFFSGSFCAIFWLKSRGLMPGLGFSNELISRDEGLHTDNACLLFSYLIHKPDQVVIHELIREAVAIETEFITESIPVRLIGMNADLMTTYIQFVADRLLIQLGYEKIWNAENPFTFMEAISLAPKTNFFEGKVSQYVKDGIGKTEEENQVGFTDDF